MSATTALVPRLDCSGTQENRHERVEMCLARAEEDSVLMRCPVCEIEVRHR